MSLARAILSGTVASEPEKRFTPNNNVAVTNFTLAVISPSRNGGEQPFMVKVTCWRQLAESVPEQIHKGDHVVVEGKLMINSYQTQEGVAKKAYEVDASSIDRLSDAPQPVMVSSEAGGAGRGKPGFEQQTMMPKAPNPYATPPKAGFATQQEVSQVQPQAEAFAGFTSEELLTEDDIPF